MELPSAAVDEMASKTAPGQMISAQRSGSARLAWALSALPLALLLATLFLIMLSALRLAQGGAFLPAYMYVTNAASWLDLVGDALNMAALLAFAIFGALIMTRYPDHPVGWIFFALSLFGIGEEFATAYAIYGLIVRPGALPGSLAAAWATEWTWTVFFGLLNVFLPLLFPTGRLPSARWRPAGWYAGVACALLTLAFMLKPGPFGNRTRLAAFESPVELFAPDGPIRLIGGAAFAAVLLSMLLAAVSLIARLRRARGDERQQLKWFCYPSALLAFWFIVQWAIRYGLGIGSPQLELGIKLAWAVTFTALPIATGIAILKYRLYEIDQVINRTLVYGGLSAAISCIYVLVVGALSALFQAQGNLLIALFGAGLVAVAFGPLREWLQRGVNRLMYGDRDEPYAVLARLGQRLETTLAPHSVLPTIVETVRDTLKLSYVAIALASSDRRSLEDDLRSGQPSGDPFEVVAAAGAPAGDLLRVPLVYQNETVGALLLGSRAPGEAFSVADQRLLNDVARQVGVAAHAVRLTADLQRSCERLVTAREEERRRLRRDLHDGLGPALATQTLKLEAARDLIGSQPERAAGLLADLISESQTAIADIRRLVYGLRPPALDELGLVGAIREQAAQYQHSGGCGASALRITVDAPDRLPPLPAAVEVAAYRIALEALNNVAKHSGARNCVISLGVGNGLHLDIRDDGCGLSLDRRSGVGLSSMRERAAELGGQCVLDSAPGAGTAVVAWLPLPS